jgi:hypothetical protein
MLGTDAIRQVQSAPRGRVRGHRVTDYVVPFRENDEHFTIH